MKIIIDPGHGINTPGKRSPDGRFREYLWNREVSNLIINELRSKHVDVTLLVPETEDISLSQRVSRVKSLCSSVGADNALLISIHSNAAGDGSSWMNAQGWSCYTTPGLTKSDELAECMYDAFENAFHDRKIRKDTSDGDRDWESNFYIIKNVPCRAVLLENFFYDNKSECAWLLTDSAKKRIVQAVVDGILIYLSEVFI